MAEPSGSSVSFSGYGALKDYLTAQDLALCWGLGGLRGGGLARLSESRGLGRSDFALTSPLLQSLLCMCVRTEGSMDSGLDDLGSNPGVATSWLYACVGLFFSFCALVS